MVAYTWTDNGSGNDNFADQQNWNDGSSGYPDSNADSAELDGTWTGNCDLDAVLTIGALSISAGYSGVFNANNNLTIDDAGGETGDFIIAAGTFHGQAATINVDGDVTLTDDTITKGTSTINMSGVANQEIIAGNNSLNNLTISNTGGNTVNIKGDLDVGGNLHFSSADVTITFESG